MSTPTKQEQQDRARILFIGLVILFGLALWLLLAVQYQYWPFAKLTEKQLPTFEPLAWIFASLLGVSLYLLGQIATFYPKIHEAPDPDNQNDFIKSTYWYVSTLLRAPILTVVIMWLLTHLTVNMGNGEASGDAGEGLGIAVNFANFPGIVKLGIAFILGFYSRVARKQLDIIAKYLFTRAWSLAEMGFQVTPPPGNIILLKEKYTFKTDPVADAVWTANIGTMEADTGTYTAPEDAAKDGEKVVARAYLRGEPSSTDFKEFTLKLFKITGNATAKPEEQIPLKLETKMEKVGKTDLKLANATWDCKNIGKLSATKGAEVVYTPPKLEASEKEKKVTVTAKINIENKDYTAELEITVK